MNNDSTKSDTTETAAAPPIAQRKKIAFLPQSRRETTLVGSYGCISGLLVMLVSIGVNYLNSDNKLEKPNGEEVVANNDQNDETPIVKVDEEKAEPPAEAEVPTIVDSKPVDEPKVPTIVSAPTERVTIKIIDENIAQFARYTVRNAEAKVAETIPVIATKATGVDHTKILVEKDATDESVVIITLQRESRPEQAIVSLVLTDEHILVSFRKEPTTDGLKSTREALLAFESALGVETKGAWEGTGTSRRLLLAKN